MYRPCSTAASARLTFGRSSWLTFCVAGWVVGVGVQPASAQLNRLAREEPEIRLRTGGRTGACDVLTFTADGKTLLAVGEDKVVHRWSVGKDQFEPLTPLYWNTFREMRGSIYALATAPDAPEPLLAIGGMGKKNADVGVFNSKTGKLVGALSPPWPPSGPYSDAGASVWSLAFRPTGRELAIGDDAGNVWVCPVVKGVPAVEKVTRAVKGGAKPTPDSRVVWVAYLADGRMAYARRDGEVRVVGPDEGLFRWEMGRVDKVVSSGDGSTLAARPARESNSGSEVEVRSLAGGRRPVRIAFVKGEFPDRIALDKSGDRLAVGLSLYGNKKAPFVYEPRSRLVVYDLRTTPPTVVASEDRDAPRPDQIAFDPRGDRLATADALDHTTTLWLIRDGKFKRLDRAGTGESLWAVGMAKDGLSLSFKNKRTVAPENPNRRADPNAPWITFDLRAETRGWAAGAAEPVAPEVTRGGWKVETDAKDDFKWSVVEPDGATRPLPWVPILDDYPRCYTFLPPGDQAKPGTVRLAVGHAWGASVFELVPGQEPRRVRRCAGHAGYVTAIAPAFEGKGFVTCGTDQTIAVWNLVDFPSEPLLGAAFGKRGERVFVTAVDRGSPADEAGLSVGDEVLEFYRGDSPKAVEKDRWLEEFRTPVPTREMLWRVERAGLRKEVDPRAKTVLLHRPAARFAPLPNGEWVLYTYRQCFYDCSANGDRYIEWLVSKDKAAEPPEVFRVDQFRKFMHRPDKVDEVLTKLVREPTEAFLYQLAPPDVTLTTTPAEVKDGENVKVTVTVKPRKRYDGNSNEVARVELWLNEHRRIDVKPGQKLAPGKTSFEVTFAVENKILRTGKNTFRAIGIGADDPGTGSGTGVSPPVTVTAVVKRPARRLFVLTAGIRYYEQLGVADLPGGVVDAMRMAKFWGGVQIGGGYDADAAVKPVCLKNEEVTKQRLLAEIEAVRKIARPGDVFVLFLAGHGVRMTDAGPSDEGGDWYYVIPRADEKTLLTRTDYSKPEVLRRAWLRDAELAEALSALDCQPLLIVDCCQSGGTGIKPRPRNVVRALTPNGLGPVVLAACAENQSAWEPSGYRGGVFSREIGRILGDEFGAADADNDGQLTLNEFYQAARDRTMRGVAGILDEGKPVRQEPDITPPADVLRDIGLDLATKPKAKGGK